MNSFEYNTYNKYVTQEDALVLKKLKVTFASKFSRSNFVVMSLD